MTHRVGVRKVSPRRCAQIVAGVAVVALGAASVVAAGGGTASAAAAPNAQAVGRFLDGAAGGSPIQSLADLKDARATAPGTTSVQNPLDVTALGQINIPLTNAVKVPTSPAVDAGVVNQVATANTNGKSLGASGAVARDGGAELSSSSGGSEPSAAKINLTDAAFGSVPIPSLPGGTTLPTTALGGITGEIHSVFARVATAKGGEIDTPSSGVAGLTLSIGSPALRGLLTQLKSLSTGTPLTALLTAANAALGGQCALTSPTASDIKLAGDAVTISPTGATITVDAQKLIAQIAGKDISDLSTSNFDLVSFLVENLPKILADGVGELVTSTTTALGKELEKCFPGTSAIVDPLLTGQGTIKKAIDTVVAPLATAGASGLTQLADGLKNVLDIGLNVQSGPGIQPREKTYAFTSKLDATPDQATPVVENQTLVRAVEINVLSAAAIPGAGGSGGVTAALANAAAGPSDVSPDAVASTSQAPSAVASTNIPTGIPAGQAGGTPDGGVPVLPLVAVLMLLAVGGGAFWHLRAQHGRAH